MDAGRDGTFIVARRHSKYPEPPSFTSPSFHLATTLVCVIRWLWFAVLCLLVVAGPTFASDAGALARAAAQIREAFSRLDVNGDLQVDEQEFEAIERPDRERRRDFLLYDFDASGRLSRGEFSCLSGLVEPSYRGTMPDPVDDLVEDAVAALDESYDHWDRRPEELVNAHTFVGNFLGSITPLGNRFVTGRIIDRADQNSDGKISRAEAKRFLEQQLGSRLDHGPPLREPTGRLVQYDRFLETDRDEDGTLSRSEFMAGWGNALPADQQFERLDRDGNGSVTYLEYADPISGCFFDPVEWFRGADQDLDAQLSRDELESAVSVGRRHLARAALNAFDDNQDGTLSLREYRLSMLANFNYPWHHRPLDRDRDGRLTYDEFVFHENDLFQLQRRYYFHRLDLDRDGSLSLDEFEFLPRPPLAVFAFSTEGPDSKRLYQSPDYPECGWPQVSPDGETILLHECPPSGSADGRIVAVSRGDGRVRIVCRGLQPSWSADGDSFVCERRGRDSGIWVMDKGGLSGRRLSAGTSPRWSPDGRSIAYLHDNGVWVHDIETDQTQQIFMREDHPYQDLGRDLVWSPDGQFLAVVGNFAATSQLLIMPASSTAAQAVRIRHSFDANCRANLNWSRRDGILLGVTDSQSGQPQLVRLAPEGEDRPEPVEIASGGLGIRSACLTPDGKWYIAVVEP